MVIGKKKYKKRKWIVKWIVSGEWRVDWFDKIK
jgi:hypothetical protein